jgi:hypothetical protein
LVGLSSSEGPQPEEIGEKIKEIAVSNLGKLRGVDTIPADEVSKLLNVRRQGKRVTEKEVDNESGASSSEHENVDTASGNGAVGGGSAEDTDDILQSLRTMGTGDEIGVGGKVKLKLVIRSHLDAVRAVAFHAKVLFILSFRT